MTASNAKRLVANAPPASPQQIEVRQLRQDIASLCRISGVGALFLDHELRIKKFSPPIDTILNLGGRDIGRRLDDVRHALTTVDLAAIARATLRSGAQIERNVQGPDGRHLLLRCLPYGGGTGSLDSVLVTLLDIDGEKRAQQALVSSDARARALLDAIPDKIVRVKTDGSVVAYNANAAEMRPTTVRMTGLNIASLVLPRDVWATIHTMVRTAVETHELQHAEYTIRETDLDEIRSYEVRTLRSGADEAVVIVRDITRRKAAEEVLREMTSNLERQANSDYLTQLNNRRGLEKIFIVEMARARRQGSRMAAVLIDCDNFKRINDVFGHATGDVVLQEIAKRLNGALRETDHIGRIGGDEFLVLMTEVREAEAWTVAERLRRSVTETPLRIGNEQVSVTASLGLSLVPADAQVIEEVIRHTQQALGRSKELGKNRVSTRKSKVATQALAETESADALLEALVSGKGIRPLAQPIRRLEDGGLAGYEVLTRGPQGSLSSPYDFFRFASEQNLLTVVDLQCLRTCIRWAAEHSEGHKVHVNIFPSTLLNCSIESLQDIFEGQHLNRFCIEISEQQFIGDPRYLEGHVAKLRELGASVAIDDVGFGRSSLESLLVLEPDVIKLDRALVHNAHKSEAQTRQLDRMLRVAQTLSAEVVAEGIELVEDLELLRSMGVKLGQGFFWGRPVRFD